MLLLIVTVLVLLLCCLLGWVVAKISLKLKNKSFTTVLLSLLFLGGYYLVYFKANALIRQLLQNAEIYGEKIKGAAYVLYFSALKSLPGQETAILSYIDPLVAVVVSLTVLGEPVAALQLVGGALILAFTLFNELGTQKSR